MASNIILDAIQDLLSCLVALKQLSIKTFDVLKSFIQDHLKKILKCSNSLPKSVTSICFLYSSEVSEAFQKNIFSRLANKLIY